MTTNVVSKNLYELLGNDHDEDSDKEPEPPVKVVDKTPARTTKRNAPAEAPASSAHASSPARGGRRGGGFSGNDGAFRDRHAGRASNQGKPTDENAQQDRPPRTEGTYRGRGGRGRGGNANFDRHSRGVGGESEKQANHGWGALEGGAELANAEAGEAIAKAEGTEALTGDAVEGAEAVEVAEPEPEDNSIAYADYLAQQAEKKLALGTLEIRQVNDAKADKKWAAAKAIAKEDEEDFVAGTGGKAKRERERTAKKIAVDIDQRFVEAPERGGGGRGGGFRGGRGRGDGQARGRGDGQARGGRGEGRGDRRPRGDGPFRGGRGGNQGPGGPRNNASGLNTDDKNAFPSLGA